MGFGANTANLMNLCGITMEQGMGVISTPEERKEATEPISLSVSFPPDTPKTPLTSGRQFLHHGATPSPSLLNPISDEDWKESTSRLSILCPKLPSPKTSEILLRRLKAGYRLALHLENTSHNIVLLLTENCQSLRIAGASIGQVDSNYGHEKLGDYFIIVALSNILRLDIGITPVEVMKRPISERNHPLTCFSIVTKVPVGKLQQLEFSTSSTADRESILSALAIVLNPEKQHRPNLLLHPRAPGFGRHLAQRAPYRTDNCLMERIPTIQRLPDVVALELETIETTIDEDVSTRTRIFESTPPRQIRASATSRTQRDQGTELALIDRSDSDDPLWGLEESTSQDDTGVLAVQTKGISKSMDAMEWRGTPEGEIIASGTTTAMWCTDNVCSNALKDIFQTFQGIMFTSSPMNSAESADKRQEVENYIAYILGAPTATSQSPSDERSKATQSPDGRTDLPVLNSNIRNRATQINASANRWRQLKSEMTFSSALERSNQHMQVLQTTKSMDDIEGLLYMQSTQPAEPSFFDATGYLSSLVDQLLPEKEQPDESSILYYDSDPEDARSHKFGRGYTRAKVKTSQPNMGSPAVLRNQLCFRTRTVGRRIEEEEVLNVVDVMKTTTLTLLWHPNPGSPSGSKPVCIEAWIERGTYLLNMSYIQPKFMWKSSYESRLEKERKVNVAVTRPEKIDLLEIARVQGEVKVDRSMHPLAQSNSCFSIETRHGMYLFQAHSVQEKEQIVYGLKLTVVRLASLLMVRDMRAVQEFFEPVSAHVPGQAPEWAR